MSCHCSLSLLIVDAIATTCSIQVIHTEQSSRTTPTAVGGRSGIHCSSLAHLATTTLAVDAPAGNAEKPKDNGHERWRYSSRAIASSGSHSVRTLTRCLRSHVMLNAGEASQRTSLNVKPERGLQEVSLDTPSSRRDWTKAMIRPPNVRFCDVKLRSFCRCALSG